MNQTPAQDGLMRVYAPGKLILSGEHAVVYGQPALAMAVNRYATATITRETRPQILFDLVDLAHQSRLNIDSLRHLKERIKRKYYRFVRGDYSIRDVLHKPFELAQVALGLFAESLNITMPHGVKIHVQSDIPIGSGMGSSAATILSVMVATSRFLQIPMTSETLFKLALEAENLQHGKSSGLDLRVAMQGGCLYMYRDQIESRQAPQLPMYLVHTGAPETTTGQCVERAATHFQSPQLCDAFGGVTKSMDTALQRQAWGELCFAIRENHRLLTHIGVVPEKVNQFISQIELVGGSAKICGAGAVSGDHAGVMLAVVDDQAVLSALCEQYGYTWTTLAGDTRGVYAV